MKKSMDDIAERILEGIANQGVCLLYEDELKPIWNGQADQPAMERGMLSGILRTPMDLKYS